MTFNVDVVPRDRNYQVYLRGFSWIVEPSERQALIAIEIGQGAAVAGPFDIEHARLHSMIARVVDLAKPPSPGDASSRVH